MFRLRQVETRSRFCRKALQTRAKVNFASPSKAADFRRWHGLARHVYLYQRPHRSTEKGGQALSGRAARPILFHHPATA
jgi:hypothetical protein